MARRVVRGGSRERVALIKRYVGPLTDLPLRYQIRFVELRVRRTDIILLFSKRNTAGMVKLVTCQPATEDG